MDSTQTFDPVWEHEIYRRGQHLNLYPFDVVVSFVYRHHSRERPRSLTRILEVGCGAGNNLWFCAREGFTVAGIDGSESAIARARARFDQEGLRGDLRVGDFTALPFEDASFDLVIDRAAITCVGRSAGRRAVAEIHRVLIPGGKLLLNVYSDRHSSYRRGACGADGLAMDIHRGTLQGVGRICFYARQDILSLLTHGWSLLSLVHVELRDESSQPQSVHAEWRAVAEVIH